MYTSQIPHEGKIKVVRIAVPNVPEAERRRIHNARKPDEFQERNMSR